MPLTSTATWPDLVAGRKARASEVEAKFDWLEGTIYSHNSGDQTNNAYDIGTPTKSFRTGYFASSVVVGGATLTSGGIGEAIKGWASVYASGGTVTGEYFNVSSLVYEATGTYLINWTIGFGSTTYGLVGTNLDTAAYPITAELSTTSSRIYVRNNAGNLADSIRVTLISFGNR